MRLLISSSQPILITSSALAQSGSMLRTKGNKRYRVHKATEHQDGITKQDTDPVEIRSRAGIGGNQHSSKDAVVITTIRSALLSSLISDRFLSWFGNTSACDDLQASGMASSIRNPGESRVDLEPVYSSSGFVFVFSCSGFDLQVDSFLG